jgi:hypothetical protein
MDNPIGVIFGSVGAVVFLCILIAVGMWGCPKYNVYSQQMEGAAILAHAQSSREVAVAEAKAKMESAQLLAQADTMRAHGVARSNEIIGKSLKENEAYLKWLWISEMKETQNQIIYVPTETNLPILEAGRNVQNKAAVGK